MAEEENEVLDWGNEDDLVSLGDEDERYTLEESLQNGPSGTPAAASGAMTPPRSVSPPPPDDEPSTSAPDQKDNAPISPQSAPKESQKPKPSAAQQASHRLTFPPRLTHALPPKPAVVNMPYLPPSHPSIVEATAMAVIRTKKSNNAGHNSNSAPSQDDSDPLPAPWEIRHPRSGTGIYYYNTQTFQSQWTRPSLRSSRAPSDPEPTKSTLNRESSPPPLTHDDRHYRPGDDKQYASNAGRRHEQATSEPNARHGRSNHSSTSARSPQRGHERSRSPTSSPTHTRDSRAHSNQRPARGRAGTKPNVIQRESDAADLPDDQERHWTPAQPTPSASNNKTRNSRRQPRPQNRTTDETIPEPKPTEVNHPPPHSENTATGYNRDRDRAYLPSEYPSTNISAPRSTSPQNDQSNYDAPAEIQRRELFEERRRSPDSIGVHIPPQPARRERPSRFDRPAPPSVIERDNGLPMKPAHDDRLGEHRRGGTSKQYDRRADQERRYEDSALQDSFPPYPQPAATEPPRETERLWIPGPNSVDRKPSPHSEVSSSSGSRKRPPLPPQEAEYRGLAKPKPAVYPDPVAQRPRDMLRTSPSFHGRDKTQKTVDPPPMPRIYPPRDELRDGVYGQMASPARPIIPAEYERDFSRGRDKGRPRSRLNDQGDVDRSYDNSMAQPPPDSNRGGYTERDLPSKPRAMQMSVPASSTYTPPGVSSSLLVTPRHQDRPSPPHGAMASDRRDNDSRPTPPLTWPERRDERPYPPADRGRGRGVPASSANSIPIGTRRIFNGSDSNVNEHPSDPSTDRFDRPLYGMNELPPHPTRSFEGNFPRPYPDPEPLPDGRQSYSRPPRGDDPYLASQLDDKNYGRRGDKPENAPRGQAPPPPQSENPMRQRSSRFSSNTGRNPRPDESLSELPPQKPWPVNDYDTPQRGRYPNTNIPHDATPPPLSREPSYTSPQWEPPPYHEPPSRVPEYRESVGYHEVPPQDAIMNVDVLPNRPGPVGSGQFSAPAGERYRRTEGTFESAGQPTPRGGNRRDHKPDIRRAPAAEAPSDDVERRRQKWNQPNVLLDENQRIERPRMLNERISALPEGRVRKQPQGTYQDKRFNGEPDTFEPRVPGRNNPRQNDFANNPPKSFEQRIDLPERPAPMARGASLLSRISPGSNDVHPASEISPQSLRDRVQIPAKREREDSVRDNHFMDTSYEADDGELDPSGSRKSRKRRRPRRMGSS